MKNFLKLFSPVAVATALALDFSLAAAQAEEPATKISISKKDATKLGSERIIGANIAIVIDNSLSIDPDENEEMMKGIRASLLSGKINYHECFAMTVVHYAQTNHIGNTHVFCTKQDAEKFAEAELGYTPGVQPSVAYGVGAGTDISKGVDGAREVFEDEKSQKGFMAQRRAVFFIGDGPNISKYSLKNKIVSLAEEFGATSYAVAIADNDPDPKDNDTIATHVYYKANLVTPPGLTYVDKDVFGNRPLPIAPGVYAQAKDFNDVERAFDYVLELAQF